MADLDILAIRDRNLDDAAHAVLLHEQIIEGLTRPPGQKQLAPAVLPLLYSKIAADAPEHSLFAAEERIFQTHSDEIARYMYNAPGDNVAQQIVVELGAGALSQTTHIVCALARVSVATASPPITFYALDPDAHALQSILHGLASSGVELSGRVTAKGICATHDDALAFVREGGLSPGARPTGQPDRPPLHLVLLGASHSSLGSLPRNAAAAFLHALPLRPGSGDTLLLALDNVTAHPAEDEARAVAMRALQVTGRVLGDEALFSEETWACGRMWDTVLRRHEVYLTSKTHQTIVVPSGTMLEFERDESVRVVLSHKYNDSDTCSLFVASDLRPIHYWTDDTAHYTVWLLERPPARLHA
ncbi:hypothetical protein BDW22DRAFT_1353586 [Trametopsis cervina]|nr:hypothetical protein BDW22DRAFT_1353586 [Trametopsis cervina]